MEHVIENQPIECIFCHNDLCEEIINDPNNSNNEISPENYIPYSCIPRLDDKQKDLSFEYAQVQE